MSAIRKINKKGLLNPNENIASPNTAVGGYLISLNNIASLFAGLLFLIGTVDKLGCSCSCRCFTNWKTMAAAQGYGNNAITYARK